MTTTASIEPVAREVFLALDGQTYPSPETFGEAFSAAVAEIGDMPRFFSADEAIDWARRSGHVSVTEDGVVTVALYREGRS